MARRRGLRHRPGTRGMPRGDLRRPAAGEPDPQGYYHLLAARGVDLEYGRKLPRLLHDGGLEAVAADAYFAVAHPASRLLETANTAQLATALVDGGWATRTEINDHVAALERDELDVATPPLISA